MLYSTVSWPSGESARWNVYKAWPKGPRLSAMPDHRTDGRTEHPHPRSIGTSRASLVSKLRLTVYSAPFYAVSSSLILIPLSRGLGIEKKIHGREWRISLSIDLEQAWTCVVLSGIVELEIDGWMDGQSAT